MKCGIRLAARLAGALALGAGAIPLTAQESPVIQLPPGYRVEKMVDKLSYATSLTWDDRGRMYVVEAGGHFLEEPRPARILRVEGDSTVEVVTLGALTPVRAPVVGIQWYNGAFYITHRAEDRTGAVSRVTMDGRVEMLFKGFLDSASEHMLGSIRLGPDGRMYFTAGPAGNAAVLGVDEERFVRRTPKLHTTPCQDIVLTGRNFKMANYLTNEKEDSVLTGAYVPFSIETRPGQVIPGVKKCGGSILSFDPDSPDPEQTIRTHAWGFRNLIDLAWNERGELYAAENGYDIRRNASRPIQDEIDATFQIREGEWYGYPDFSRTLLPLTLPRFEPPDSLQNMVYVNGQPVGKTLAFVIDHEASGLDAPDTSLVFGRHAWNSSPSGIDVAPASWGEWAGHVFVDEWGDLAPSTNVLREEPVGVRIVRIDPETEEIHEFVANPRPGPASNQGAKGRGLERPFDVAFGPDGAMYITDFGLVEVTPGGYIWTPRTGRIWKVTRTGNQSPQQNMQMSRQQIQKERIPVRKGTP
jgi:glucose/arabinose dehydrogenase